MRILLAALALLLLFAPASAEAAKKDKNRKGDPTVAIKKKLTEAALPTDVLASANKIVDEHATKLKDAQAKVDAVLTSEQKAAAKTAKKDAKTAGKKRKEAKAEVEAALKLTDEQKAKLAAAEKELAAAQKDLQKGLQGVLSAEQFAKVGLKTKKKKNA